MITATAAKKGTGLDDLFKGYTPQQLEERKKVTVEHSNPTLQQALEMYKRALSTTRHGPELRVEYPSSIVLSPEDIDLFLQHTIEYEHHPSYFETTPAFVSHLIRTSFLNGHRHFSLNTKNILPLNYLGSHFVSYKDLSAPLENPVLYLTIDGDVGDNFGFTGRRIHYHVRGNTGKRPFEGLSQFSMATIEGKINGSGFNAFNGSVQSTFFVHEYDGGIPKSTRNCIFNTDDEKTFRSLRGLNFGENNHVYLVDKDNREVILKE